MNQFDSRDADIRRDQINAGRAVLGVPESRRGAADTYRSSTFERREKPKGAAKGHEAYLKGLVATKANVVVQLSNADEPITGVMEHADKYTITVRTEVTTGVVSKLIFKSAIESLYSTDPTPVTQ